MMAFRVALAQVQVEPTLEKNLRKANRYVAKAVRKKADVVVFPECFVGFDAFSKAQSEDVLAFFKGLAKKHRLDIVCGSWIEHVGRKRYSVSHYVEFRGRVLARYRKINLWIPEVKEGLSRGNAPCVFQTRFGKAALVICWDLGLPELFRHLFRRKVQVVYCPSFWPDDVPSAKERDPRVESRIVNALCYARSFENNFILAYADAAGVSPGDPTGKIIGFSQLVAPLKGVLASAPHDRETLLVADVDLRLLNVAEKAYRPSRVLRLGKKLH